MAWNQALKRSIHVALCGISVLLAKSIGFVLFRTLGAHLYSLVNQHSYGTSPLSMGKSTIFNGKIHIFNGTIHDFYYTRPCISMYYVKRGWKMCWDDLPMGRMFRLRPRLHVFRPLWRCLASVSNRMLSPGHNRMPHKTPWFWGIP